MKKLLLNFIVILLFCLQLSAQDLSTYTDTRNNKTYKIVQIGDQLWFAENLSYPLLGSRYYKNNEEKNAKYGMYYTWYEASQACPYGWHLPTKDEWEILFNHYEILNGSVQGEKPKKAIRKLTFLMMIDAGNSGLNLHMGGFQNSRLLYSEFNSKGIAGFYWSSNEKSKTLGAGYEFVKMNKSYGAGKTLYKYFRLSMRCVKD